MVEQVLAADPRAAMYVRVVAPTKHTRVRQVVREEVAQPADAIARCPRLLAVAVEAMHGNDTGVRSAFECTQEQ
jgi:hypothetical protein